MPGRVRSLAFLLAAVFVALTACDHYTAIGGQAAASDAAPSLAPTPAPSPGPPQPAADCRTIALRDPTAVVEQLRADGRCVDPSTAVVYRCDPSFDPIALVQEGDAEPHRFLGGTFAVPVDALPAQAHAIGIAGAGRLWMDPADPRWLWVQADGAITRWLSLPKTTLPSTPSIQLIGDSILDGAAAEVTARLAGWQVAIDAMVGRSSYEGVPIAQALSPVPAVVVVELGVNDHDLAAFTANAAAIVDAVRTARFVVWVAPHAPDTVTEEIDRAVTREMATLPNGSVADWNAAVPLDQLTSDGVHLLDPTGKPFAEFLTPPLQAWREAVDGRGPDRCGAQVAAAIAG
ncbi:MAG: hypothetical protein ACM3OO_10025 [Planctomycetaceae bacterium]